MESLRAKAKCARERGKESQLLQPERYYHPHQAVLPLKAHNRYYRRTPAPLSHSTTNSCVRTTRDRYYRLSKRH